MQSVAIMALPRQPYSVILLGELGVGKTSLYDSLRARCQEAVGTPARDRFTVSIIMPPATSDSEEDDQEATVQVCV